MRRRKDPAAVACAAVACAAVAVLAALSAVTPAVRREAARSGRHQSLGLLSDAELSADRRRALPPFDAVGAREWPHVEALRCARGFRLVELEDARVCVVDVPDGVRAARPFTGRLWRGYVGFVRDSETFRTARDEASYREVEVQDPVVCPRPFMSVGSTVASNTRHPVCLISIAHVVGAEGPPLGALFPYVAVRPGGRLSVGYGVARGVPPHACPPGFERAGECTPLSELSSAPEPPRLAPPAEVAAALAAGTEPARSPVYVTVVSHGFEDQALQQFRHNSRGLGLPVVVVAADTVAHARLRAAGVGASLAYRRGRSPPAWCMDDYGTQGWRAVHENKVGTILELIEAGFPAVALDVDVLLMRRDMEREWRRDARWDVRMYDVVLATDAYWISYANPTPAAVALYRAAHEAVMRGGWDQSWVGRLARERRDAGLLRVGTVGHFRAKWVSLGFGYGELKDAPHSFKATVGGVVLPGHGDAAVTLQGQPEGAEADEDGAREAHECVVRLEKGVQQSFEPVAVLLGVARAARCLAVLEDRALARWFDGVTEDRLRRDGRAVRRVDALEAARRPPTGRLEVVLTGPRWRDAVLALRDSLPLADRLVITHLVAPPVAGSKRSGKVTLACLKDTTYGPAEGREVAEPGLVTCCRACRGEGECHFTHDRMLFECPAEGEPCVDTYSYEARSWRSRVGDFLFAWAH